MCNVCLVIYSMRTLIMYIWEFVFQTLSGCLSPVSFGEIIRRWNAEAGNNDCATFLNMRTFLSVPECDSFFRFNPHKIQLLTKNTSKLVCWWSFVAVCLTTSVYLTVSTNMNTMFPIMSRCSRKTTFFLCVCSLGRDICRSNKQMFWNWKSTSVCWLTGWQFGENKLTFGQFHFCISVPNMCYLRFGMWTTI